MQDVNLQNLGWSGIRLGGRGANGNAQAGPGNSTANQSRFGIENLNLRSIMRGNRAKNTNGKNKKGSQKNRS